MNSSGPGMMPPKQPNQADFVFKLFQMLQGNETLISYCEGRVQIKNPSLLANEVLPRYFRTSRFSSFQRQLNNFGFRKIEGKGKLQPCTYFRDDLDGLPASALLNIGRATKPLLPVPTTHTQSRSLRVAAQQGRSGHAGGGVRRPAAPEANPYRTEYRNVSKRRRLATESERGEDGSVLADDGMAGRGYGHEHGRAHDPYANRVQDRHEGGWQYDGQRRQDHGHAQSQAHAHAHAQGHGPGHPHVQRGAQSSTDHRYLGNGAGQHLDNGADGIGPASASSSGDFYLLLNSVGGAEPEPGPPRHADRSGMDPRGALHSTQAHYQGQPHSNLQQPFQNQYQGQQYQEQHHLREPPRRQPQQPQHQQQPPPPPQQLQQHKQPHEWNHALRSSPTSQVGNAPDIDNAATNDFLEVLTLLDSGVQVGDLSSQQQARFESSMTASIFGKRHKMQSESTHNGGSQESAPSKEPLTMYEAPQSVTGGNSYDCVASLEIAPPLSAKPVATTASVPDGQATYPERSPAHYPRSMAMRPPPGGGRAVYVAPLTMREAGMSSNGKVASIFGKRHTLKKTNDGASA